MSWRVLYIYRLLFTRFRFILRIALSIVAYPFFLDSYSMPPRVAPKGRGTGRGRGRPPVVPVAPTARVTRAKARGAGAAPVQAEAEAEPAYVPRRMSAAQARAIQ